MLQTDLHEFTHMCEYGTLRDLKGACYALHP